MVKLLSSENLVLLHTIETQRPDSLPLLRRLHVARSQINLEPEKNARAGIVDFAGRMRPPRLIASGVTHVLDLMGAGSVVSIERPEVR
jgi:predicted transcriptional regulator